MRPDSGALAARPVRRSGGGWMATFLDLAALLLAFFVLTFSMGTMDEQRWAALSRGLVTASDAGLASEPGRRMAERTLEASRPAPGGLNYLEAVLAARIDRLGLADSVRFERTPRALLLTIEGAGDPGPMRLVAGLMPVIEGQGRRASLLVAAPATPGGVRDWSLEGRNVAALASRIDSPLEVLVMPEGIAAGTMTLRIHGF